MVGMLQILTWMFAFYIVLKGIEILQISLASSRDERTGMVIWSVVVLLICIGAAILFVGQQDEMARHISRGINAP